MKKENSLLLLERLQEQVEQHIQIAVSQFQNMSDERLLQPSSSGGWSIAQCLEHLNSYGRFYLPEIKKGLKKKNSENTSEWFKSGWLGQYFTRMMEPAGPRKYKAFKDHMPAAGLYTVEVVAEFIRQQEILLQYLEEAKKVDLNTVRLPISITRLIRLKLGDVFQFLIMHNERHIQQALRNVSHF